MLRFLIRPVVASLRCPGIAARPFSSASPCGSSASAGANGSAAPAFNLPDCNSTARLLFLGPPGAGKGTFAARIAPLLSVPHISTGDIIRDEIKRGPSRGKLVRQLSEAGELVPDEVVIQMTQDRLARSDASCGFILDGFPRTRAQAEALDTFSPIDAVIDVEFPEDLLVLKIASRRVCTCCGRNYNLANIRRGDVELHPLLPKVENVCDKVTARIIIDHGMPALLDNPPLTVAHLLLHLDCSVEVDWYSAQMTQKTSCGTVFRCIIKRQSP